MLPERITALKKLSEKRVPHLTAGGSYTGMARVLRPRDGGNHGGNQCESVRIAANSQLVKTVGTG